MWITANGNILASGNLCFRVFNLQLKVINKVFSYLYSVWVIIIIIINKYLYRVNSSVVILYTKFCPGDPVKHEIEIILRNKKDKNS